MAFTASLATSEDVEGAAAAAWKRGIEEVSRSVESDTLVPGAAALDEDGAGAAAADARRLALVLAFAEVLAKG